MTILQYPNEILKQKSITLSKDNFMDFLLTFKKYVELVKDNALGLACIQTGMNVSIIWVKNFGYMINPRIIYKSKDLIGSVESCLSVLSETDKTKYRYFLVERHKSIKVLYRNEKWEICRHRFDNELSIVVQHEYSHLEGLCLPDYSKKEILENEDD